METINKEEANKRLIALKSEVEKLEKVINTPVNIKNRVKTFKDACEVTGIQTYGDARKKLNLKEKYGFKLSTPIEKIDNPYIKLSIIVLALNEGWEADMENGDQNKYYPYFRKNKAGFSFVGVSYYNWHCDFPVSLLFKSQDLSSYCGTQFVTLYEEYLIGK